MTTPTQDATAKNQNFVIRPTEFGIAHWNDGNTDVEDLSIIPGIAEVQVTISKETADRVFDGGKKKVIAGTVTVTLQVTLEGVNVVFLEKVLNRRVIEGEFTAVNSEDTNEVMVLLRTANLTNTSQSAGWHMNVPLASVTGDQQSSANQGTDSTTSRQYTFTSLGSPADLELLSILEGDHFLEGPPPGGFRTLTQAFAEGYVDPLSSGGSGSSGSGSGTP